MHACLQSTAESVSLLSGTSSAPAAPAPAVATTVAAGSKCREVDVVASRPEVMAARHRPGGPAVADLDTLLKERDACGVRCSSTMPLSIR